MGEKLQFDKRLRLEFHGARITLDAGLLACRELNGVLGLMEMALCSMSWCPCYGSQCIVVWQDTRIPMMRYGWPGILLCMESFANVDGRGFQEQRYTVRMSRGLLQDSEMDIDN